MRLPKGALKLCKAMCIGHPERFRKKQYLKDLRAIAGQKGLDPAVRDVARGMIQRITRFRRGKS